MEEIDLSEVTSELAGIINSIRVLDRQISESAMTGPQIVAEFAELYPPAALFAPDILSTPIVYKAIRDWLTSHGATLPHHSSRRVMMQLAINIYSDDEEKIAAEAIVKDIVNTGRRIARSASSIPAAPDHVPQGDGPCGQDKLAYYLGMTFRDKESKFSGDLVNNFTEAIRMIDNEYNSIVRQNRVKNHLAGLRLSKYTSEGLDDLLSLEKVYKLITKLSPQVPMSHRSEAHKIEFLRNATVGYPWATEPLSRVATHGLSFQQLYSELEAALHLAREARLANIRDKLPAELEEPPSKMRTCLVSFSKGKANIPAATNALVIPDAVITEKSSCRRRPVESCKAQDGVSVQENRALSYSAPRPLRIVSTVGARRPIEQQPLDDPGDPPHVHITEPENDEDPDFDLFDALVSYVEGLPAEKRATESHIYLSNGSNQHERFNGACLDTGAQRSVVGKAQAEAYYRFMGIPLAIIPATKRLYKFGSERKASVGKAKFCIPYAEDRHIMIELDVVEIAIPLLIGLDVLDKYKLVVDNVENRLICRDPKWSAPLTASWVIFIMNGTMKLCTQKPS
eukprot:IDg3182t1